MASLSFDATGVPPTGGDPGAWFRALRDVRRTRTGFLARCPAHRDRSPSLSLSPGPDGRVLLHCHAGCAADAVLDALGVTWADLAWPGDDVDLPRAAPRDGRDAPRDPLRERPGDRDDPSLREVAVYVYTDEAGAPLYRVRRLEGARSDGTRVKTFRQERFARAGGLGTFLRGMDGTPPTLWRRERLAADRDAVVYVVEGEKCVLALEAVGLVATCNSGGATKWPADGAALLAGRHVVLVPDRDAPGQQHARVVAAALQGHVASLTVALPDVPAKGDVVDALAAGQAPAAWPRQPWTDATPAALAAWVDAVRPAPAPSAAPTLALVTSPGPSAPAVRAAETALAPTPPSAREFPTTFLDVPGFVGELAQFIVATAKYPQPALALAAALAAVATLAGRKVATGPYSLRTNLYVVGMAPSGGGKEHTRAVLRKLFKAAGVPQQVAVENLASDAAIASALVASPASCFLLDEIGRSLLTMTGPRAAAHLSGIVTTLLTLTGQASDAWHAKAYADPSRNQVVEHPNLSLYGTTTRDALVEGLSMASLENGLISRLLLFSGTREVPLRQKVADATLPAALVAHAQWWVEQPTVWHPEGTPRQNLTDATTPSPRLLPATDRAEAMAETFTDRCDAIRRELGRTDPARAAVWARTAMNAEKLALIRAAGCLRDRLAAGESPRITPDDMAWGCALAEHLTHDMLALVDEHFAENDHERSLKRVYAKVHGAGPEGITASLLTRRTQWLKETERRDILGSLVTSRRIVVTEEPSPSGPPVRRYTAAEYRDPSPLLRAV